MKNKTDVPNTDISIDTENTKFCEEYSVLEEGVPYNTLFEKTSFHII